jgi:hypothetical protein
MGQNAASVLGIDRSIMKVTIKILGIWMPFIPRQEGIQEVISTRLLLTYQTPHFSAV